MDVSTLFDKSINFASIWMSLLYLTNALILLNMDVSTLFNKSINFA